MFSVNNMRQPQILHFDEGADIFKKQPTIASEWKQRASTTFSSVFYNYEMQSSSRNTFNIFPNEI